MSKTYYIVIETKNGQPFRTASDLKDELGDAEFVKELLQIKYEGDGTKFYIAEVKMP